MAKATKTATKKPAPKSSSGTKPKFPYTITVGALRRILQEIPKRPKPTAFNFALINAWGIKDNNARTAIAVIKALGLIDNGDVPTQHYVDYMKNESGPANLAARVKEIYSQLFQTSHEPYRDSLENLRNFFNIHSGGSEATINYQIQTFKTLCEFADFNSAASPNNADFSQTPNSSGNSGNNTSGPTININLHIHLPETKSRADYEEIIKDIAKYIYQK
ncbi:MAG: DUF5343 domain-containing protein [Bacteroidetes bacterium]|nr:DUF5343 domain-containing protein [Bacteroidota bacterium]